MQIEIVKFKELKAYAKNARKHPRKQIELLVANINKFGFTTPVLIDENNEVIAGHGRLLALKVIGETNVPCVRIKGLTNEEIKALRLADNQIAQMGEWEMSLVVDELKGLDPEMFELTGFDSDLLLEEDQKDDAIPAIPTKPKSKLGDLYEIGPHRVLCGDSTKDGDVEKLFGEVEKAQMCFTDPPYNVDYQGGMGTHKQNKREGIKNDKMDKESFKAFMEAAMRPIVERVTGGIYVCMSSSELDSLKGAFENVGGHWQSFIIWVKNNFTLSRADYQNTYEPILYGWNAKTKNHFFVDRRDISNVWEDFRDVRAEYDGTHTIITFQGFKVKIEGKVAKGEVIKKKQHTDIWRFDKPTRSAEHPTMKPVALCMEAIVNSSEREEIVLDTFLGSGSTLIAAEKSGRKCFGIELDPKFVDVIIQRYCEYTGETKVIKNGKEIKWENS